LANSLWLVDLASGSNSRLILIRQPSLRLIFSFPSNIKSFYNFLPINKDVPIQQDFPQDIGEKMAICAYRPFEL